MGRRTAQQRRRWARGARRPRNEVPPLASDPVTPRRPVEDRLDQHPGTQLHLQATCGRPGRGLRRRDVLCALRHEPAAAGRGPRLRRHRVPAGRRGGDLRGPDTGRRSGRGTGTGRAGHMAAQSVPGTVRSCSGRDGDGRRRDASDLHASHRSTRPGSSACSSRAAARSRSAAAPPRKATARACSVASASSTRHRSTTTGPTAATPRSPRHSRWVRTASSPRSPSRGCSVVAVRPSRPAASGPRWPPRPPSRTTSCATPTSPSRARSRTASCSRATRSPRSRR